PAEAPPEPPSEPPLTASTTTPLGGSPPPATPPPATAAPAQRPASGIAAPEADPLAPSLTAVSAGPPASSPSVSRAAPLEDSDSTHQVAPSVFAGLSLVSAPPLLSGPVPTSQGLLPDYPAGVPLSPQARARYRHLARPFFRRLVRLRRLWHLWQQTGHILRGTAWLERPLDLLRFYQLHRQLQPLLHSAEAPWGPTDPIPGWLTAAWLRHPQPVALLRWLSPPQRLQLLLDWRGGEQYLAQTCQQLHQQLQRHRQARRRAQRWTRLIRCLLRQPESWLLWALSLLLLITLLRSLRHG
ncbi:MAG: hypothetical protein NZ703_11770, partial [Gemmataceae bacterium]|nr:hypothetical protein [Gemmataceae bacterium]